MTPEQFQTARTESTDAEFLVTQARRIGATAQMRQVRVCKVEDPNGYVSELWLDPDTLREMPYENAADGWRIVSAELIGGSQSGRCGIVTRDNDSVRAELMHIGQTADFPPNWERVAVPRHPHWCGAVEHVDGRWLVRTTTSDDEPWSDDDRFATAAVVPAELAQFLYTIGIS